MTIYYKKLVQHKKLIPFWIFFGSNSRNIFKINYQFLDVLYNKGCFIDFKILISCIKKIFPLFLNISKIGGSILFISTKFLYCQTVHNNYYFNIIKELINKKLGIFTNFSILGYTSFKKFNFHYNPSFIVFLYLKNNTSLLIESKKKNIPTISLINSDFNSSLIEYPLCINSSYFYTTYFFSKFLFKLVLLNK
jgi:ribosomal protein S2